MVVQIPNMDSMCSEVLDGVSIKAYANTTSNRVHNQKQKKRAVSPEPPVWNWQFQIFYFIC